MRGSIPAPRAAAYDKSIYVMQSFEAGEGVARRLGGNLMIFGAGVNSCAGCSYGVMVSTLDFESSDPGSNPGRSSFLCAAPSIGIRLPL